MKYDFSDLKRRTILRRSSPEATQVEEEIIRAEAATIPAEDGLIPAEEVEAEVEAIKQIHTTIPRGTFNAIIATSMGTTKQNATRSKEKKVKPIIQKRRMCNQLFSWPAARLTKLMQAAAGFSIAGVQITCPDSSSCLKIWMKHAS
jgi:hypothetical protein